MALKIRLEVVTAEKLVLSDEVDVIIAPAVDGQISILPRHAPLLTLLQPGELKIRKGETEYSLAVSGGFIEIEPNRVTVLADTAERAEEIDIQRAQAALERAQAALANQTTGHGGDLTSALAAIRRSQARVRVARRRVNR